MTPRVEIQGPRLHKRKYVGLLSLPLNKSNDRIVFEQFFYFVSSSQIFFRVLLVLRRLSSQKVESVFEIRIDGFSKYNIAECYNDGSASLMKAVSESELFAQDSCFYSGVPALEAHNQNRALSKLRDPEPCIPKIISLVFAYIPSTTNCLIIYNYTQSGRPMDTRAMFIHAELINNLLRFAAHENIETTV